MGVRACVMAAMSLNLPPGFRFRPTELEIINYYLRLKITGNDEEAIRFIREVNLLDWKPWELPGTLNFSAWASIDFPNM